MQHSHLLPARLRRALPRVLAVLSLLLAAGAALSGGRGPGPAGPVAEAATITPEIVGSFSVPGNRARALSWGDGGLWLADESSKLYRLSPAGAVQATSTLTFTVEGLAWDSLGGSLWAGSSGGARRLGPAGAVLQTLPDAYYWGNSGLAWAGDDLFVGNYNDGLIHKHSRQGAHVLSWTTLGKLWSHPTGMAYDGVGLWIADSCEGGENKVARFSLSGALLDSFDFKASGGCTPGAITSLAWDGEHLWLTNNASFTVYKLDVNPLPPPTVASLLPNSAPDTAGEVPVLITGSNFREPVAARMEGVELLDVRLESPTTLRAVIPVTGVAQGVYDLTVTSGRASVTARAAFTVRPASIPESPADEPWVASHGGNAELTEGVGPIIVDPHDPDVIYASSANGDTGDALYRSTDGGQSWGPFYASYGVADLAVDPEEPGTLYLADNSSVFGTIMKSGDGGQTWNETACCPTQGSASVTAIAIDPINTSTLYAGMERYATGVPGVYKTTDGGAHWARQLAEVDVLDIAINPQNPNILYAAAADTLEVFDRFLSGYGGVYRSADGGLSWTSVFSHTRVNALAIDPQSPQLIYAATEGGGVWKSADGGASWLRANTGLARLIVRALAIDPSNPRLLYAGLWEGGVYRSLDGGASWRPINAGLTGGSVLALAVDPSARQAVFAGTPAHGIFRRTGPPPPPEGATYARVTDADGQPVAGAQIYHNGSRLNDAQGRPLLTNSAGNLILEGVQAGDILVALAPQYTRPTARGQHDGWAYQIVTSNLRVNPDGSLQSFRVVNPGGAQPLQVRAENPLVLFNLLVSIEWDADSAYLAQIERAMERASDYLYQYSDGQMAFGRVAVYDRARHWADADIQISASNIVRPHAYIGGIISGDRSHVIRVGRAWNGLSGDQGPWDEPDGYRTIGHEFAHYALFLYDSYFGFERDGQGNIVGQYDARCTGLGDAQTISTNASVMDSQYTASKLAVRGVAGLWSASCEEAAHWQLTGESDWETLARVYADPQSPPRWRLSTPATRGAVMPGPLSLPDSRLRLPEIKTEGGSSTVRRTLTILGPGGSPYQRALVDLYKADSRVIWQGFPDSSGRIEIYGADPDDEVRVASFDGGLAGSLKVGAATALTLRLQPVGGVGLAAAAPIPHMRVLARPDPGGDKIRLLIFLEGFAAGSDPGLIVTLPGGTAGSSPPLSYSPASGAYEAEVSFSATERGSGRILALGFVGNSLVRMHSSYRLQRVRPGQSEEIYSDDGNLSLHLEPDSLDGQQSYVTVMPPGAIPGPLPGGMALLGNVYDIRASLTQPALGRPAVLRLRYDRVLLSQSIAPGQLRLYRWHEGDRRWEQIAASVDEEHRTLVALVHQLGSYALLAPDQGAQPTAAPTFTPTRTPTASPTPSPTRGPAALSPRLYLPLLSK